MQQVDARIEREAAEMEFGLGLKSVDLGLVLDVELDPERGERRIADDDLEVFVIVIEAADGGADVPVREVGFPAGLEGCDLLGLERGGQAQTDRQVEAARAEAGGHEAVEEVIGAGLPAERHLVGKIVRLGGLLGEDGSAVLNDIDMVGRLAVGVAAAHLELEFGSDVEAELAEHGERTRGVGALQRVNEKRLERIAGRQRIVGVDDELIRLLEVVLVPHRGAAEQPGEALVVGRDQVDLLRGLPFVHVVEEIPVPDRRGSRRRVREGRIRAIEVRAVDGVRLLVARQRTEPDPAIELVFDLEDRPDELVARCHRRVRGDLEQIAVIRIGGGAACREKLELGPVGTCRIGAEVEMPDVGLGQE